MQEDPERRPNDTDGIFFPQDKKKCIHIVTTFFVSCHSNVS